jgi:hypothetical protein
MSDIIEIEQAVTLYIAEKLRLTVDKDIFRGDIPTGMDGICVFFTHGSFDEFSGMESYYFTIIIKNPERDKVFKESTTLTGLFPLYGLHYHGNCRLKCILKMMNRIIPACPERGQIDTVAVCNIKVIS